MVLYPVITLVIFQTGIPKDMFPIILDNCHNILEYLTELFKPEIIHSCPLEEYGQKIYMSCLFLDRDNVYLDHFLYAFINIY